MWETIGKIFVGYIVSALSWSLLKGLYGCFIGSALGLNANLKKLGKWAIVTGSTDGIGKAYAFEMARKGLNVVLISRTPFKLQNVAAELQSKYNVETKIIDVDFTSGDIYDRIAKEINGLDIGVLINNVGMSYDYPEHFTAISEKMINSLIACNILSVTMMTKLVLCGMEARKRGLIINVSSLSSIIPAPFLAVYGATKAYVVSFSRSIQNETKSSGVIVQCLTPGFVVSKLSGFRSPNLMVPSSMEYVRASLNTSGIEASTGGYYMHKVQIWLLENGLFFLPGYIIRTIVFNQLNATRLRALRKKERMKNQ